ncbi:MAG: flagellar biosynthesis regulator FlaF [Pseudomonadota bacterium]
MNAPELAHRAYAGARGPVTTSRGIEYKAFAKITRELRDAETVGAPGFARLASAVHANRRLWTLLAADVSDRQNGLPEALRARIFFLNEFTQHESRKVLRREATCAALIDINAAVMQGLRPEAGAP